MTVSRIGALDTRLTLEAPADTPDGGGGAQQAWSPVTDLWANVAPVSGRDDLVGDALTARVTHRITIRWRSDITCAMRLRSPQRLFRIEAVLEPDRRRLLLLCVEERA